ncbi:MAG: ferrous iron transport protein B [Acidobacteriota bacterium]
MASSLPQPSSSPAAPSPKAPADLVLVGNPNVGKSVLFGSLTHTYVAVSNYPGTTVEVCRSRLAGSGPAGGAAGMVVDTPGTNTLIPTSEDEKVTRDILLAGGYRGVVQVGDAKNLRRILLLTVQLAEMAVPMVLCLNMRDEAARRGLSIDRERLSRILGIPTVETVAVRHHGLKELRRALKAPDRSSFRVRYSDPIEDGIQRLLPLLPLTPVSARSLALMVLAEDETLVDYLHASLDEKQMDQVRKVIRETGRAYGEPVRAVISRERLASVDRVVSRVQKTGPRRDPVLAAWLERMTMHPIWGVPVLLAVLWAAYEFVGVFGAGTAVDFIENRIFNGFINPGAISLADRFVPVPFLRDLLVGDYGLITMALTYAIAIILPIVATFFLSFGFLEDSGYLPRLAVMVNRVFKLMGLNGKAVLPMVLGLGCDTMATLTTRILETRKERMIVIILLALGVPCSAQLGVIFALLSGLSLAALGIWMTAVTLTLFGVGFLAARLLPGEGSDFILELPPIRRPRLSNLLAKTLGRIEWYLKEAAPLFFAGTFILFLLDRAGALQVLEEMARPLIVSLLSLPAATTQVFIVGFLRRDFGAAGLLQMSARGEMDPIQVVVALVTITLFIPCIANLLMIIKERGWKTAMAISAFIFPFALLVGAGLNLVLRVLQVKL